MAWSFARALEYLDISVTPDRQLYPAGAPVRLSVTIVNRDTAAFSPPDDYARRSAQIRFMERDGWGLFVVTLGALFPVPARLRIAPGKTARASVTLRPRDLASRTEVLHYELPARVRTFQVFLPLAADDADGLRNMLSANSAGVTTRGSWIR
jgi:hypothetical protein